MLVQQLPVGRGQGLGLGQQVAGQHDLADIGQRRGQAQRLLLVRRQAELPGHRPRHFGHAVGVVGGVRVVQIHRVGSALTSLRSMVRVMLLRQTLQLGHVAQHQQHQLPPLADALHRV